MSPNDSCIIVLNAGSSSIKFAVYEGHGGFQALARGQIEGIGTAPHLKARLADGAIQEQRWPSTGFRHHEAIDALLAHGPRLTGGRRAIAVGHRVVHGGTAFVRPVRVDDAILAQLAALEPLAPLHQPHNLEAIRAASHLAPHLPQVACFDTGFHRAQPPLAQAFGLPRRFAEAGIRRYGFHGLSYDYISRRLRELAPDLAAGRVIVAHLGNGASLCAMQDGRSIASTMGFTAVDGLIMGTRCGAIDPGVLLHLMDVHGMDARAIERLIYQESGLLGVSGLSSDMRTLRESPEPHAREAIDLFVYRIVREIGSLTAALGGLDGLVFTAGIGENDPATRAEVIAGCQWLGLSLDAARNAAAPQAGRGVISPAGSPNAVWVIPTDEEVMIARYTAEVINA